MWCKSVNFILYYKWPFLKELRYQILERFKLFVPLRTLNEFKLVDVWQGVFSFVLITGIRLI